MLKHTTHNAQRTTHNAKLLITAGPTREALDTVRFISNQATGTLGYCLARLAKKQGWEVTLISGPTNLRPPEGVEFIAVGTAGEMYKQVKSHFFACDCLIMSAAVCDFRPLNFSIQKIDKENFKNLKLKKTVDILYEIGKIKNGRILVGFALESKNLIKNAREKLRNKNLDMIFAYKLGKNRVPFGETKTSPVLIHRDNSCQRIPSSSKSQLAKIILEKIWRRLNSFC